MRKVTLSIALAVLLLGTAAISSADAQWRRRADYGYSYPTYGYSYSYPSWGYSYATPGYSAYYYNPGYSSYYSGPAYYYPAYRYRGWRR
jgi:hypothetical protein